MSKNRKEILEEDKELKEEEEPKKIKRLLIDDDDDEEYEELTTEERVVNIEKKVNQIFVVSVICLVVSVLALLMLLVNNGDGKKDTTTNTDNTQEDASSYTYDTSAFKEIKATDIATESKKETIVVMLGRQGCGYCAQFAPIIANVAAKYGVTVRYIDITKIVDSSGQVVDEASIEAIKAIGGEGSWSQFAQQYFGSTPQTMFIKNNKVVYGLAGAADESTTSSVFETVGFKKK